MLRYDRKVRSALSGISAQVDRNLQYSEEGIKILYHLLKMRDDFGTSTLFSCQYSPDEWGKQLSDKEECYGKLDGIRRRLTTGFTVLIERA